MKFTCDRCGKRFSSVDEPMAGRVYRIRCRCGNTIEIAAPRVLPDPVPPAKAAPPLRAPAPPAGTPAGTGPVRPERSAAPAAAPRRGGLAGSFEAPIPRAPRTATGAPAPAAHPQATPDAALLGDPFAAIPEPGAPTARAPRAAAPPAPAREPGSTSSVRMPAPEPSPWPEAPFADGLPPELQLPRDEPPPGADALPPELQLPRDEPFPPQASAPPPSDPFADAAAHAARLGERDEPPAPGAGFPEPASRRTPAAAFPASAPLAAADLFGDAAPPAEASSTGIPRPRTPTRPEPVPGAAREDEAVDLSQSEQYELPRITRHAPRRRSGPARLARLAIWALVAAGVGLGGAGGAWWFLQERASAPARAVVATPAPARQAPLAPPVASPALAQPEPERAAPPLAKPEPPAPPPAEPPARKAADRAAADRRAEARAAAERSAAAERAAQRRADAERKAEAQRRAEAERNAADRKVAAAAPADPPAQEPVRKKEPPAERAEPLPDGLDPAQMQAVIRANRAALEACVQKAVADPATSVYAGRKVSFIVLVAPNGKAEGALEDTDLDASAFGACLKKATAKMSFPPFRGEPVGARIPLVIGRAE